MRAGVQKVLCGAFEDRGEWKAIFRNESAAHSLKESELSRYENFGLLSGRADGGDDHGREFIYGPSSGGMLESIRFNLRTDGELIASVMPEYSFKDRRIVLSGKDVYAALLLAERINGPYAASYSSLYCRTVESLLGLEPEHDVQMTRILMCELERIACHLFVIGRLCEAASQHVATSHIYALREKMLRTISMYFGHRFFFGVNDIGRVRRSANFYGLSDMVNGIVGEFSSIWKHLASSTLFIDRIQRTCTVHLESSVGPTARASGYSTDERQSNGILPYSDFSFNFRKEYEGDALSRALVRSHEIEESLSVVIQVLDSVQKIDASPAADTTACSGECVGKIESPGGEMLLYLRAENDIQRAYLRSSSLANLQAFVNGMKGSVFTDFAFAWESFGLWVSEMGGVK